MADADHARTETRQPISSGSPRASYRGALSHFRGLPGLIGRSIAKLPRHVLSIRRTWLLAWDLADLGRFYKPRIAQAKEQRDRELAERLWGEWRGQVDCLTEEMDSIRSDRLVKKARKLDLAVPPSPYGTRMERDEYWERGVMTGLWYLTTAGINKLRTDIRAEQRARQKMHAHWIAWIAALTGVIGALTGLFSILLRR